MKPKVCPVCEQKIKIVPVISVQLRAVRYKVVCANCVLSFGWETDKLELIKKWNKRGKR